VLALANPGATLAAIITVAGIWAVAIGVTRVVIAFEVKRLPKRDRQGLARPDSEDRGRRRLTATHHAAAGSDTRSVAGTATTGDHVGCVRSGGRPYSLPPAT
jgi:hypothetical protein